ncbi:MAG TPA: tetratricopeptide repeat protein [Kiritimatiellia bacterium]
MPAHAKGDETDADFTSGRAALEDGLYDLAEKKFDTYIAGAFFKDKKALGSLYLVQALHGQGRYEDVIQWLDDHAAWFEDSGVAADVVFWRARALYDLGRYADCLAALDGYEKLFPGGAYMTQVERLRGRSLLNLQHTDEALALFEAFEHDYPGAAEAPENLLDLASAYIARDRQTEAEAAMRRIVSEYAGSDAAQQARLWLGYMLIARLEWDEARTMLQALAERDGGKPDLRGSAWFALGRVEDAKTNLTAAADAYAAGVALAVNPLLRNEGRLGQARTLVRAQRADEAVVLLDEAIKSDPAQPGVGDMQLELAMALLGRKDFERALAAFQKYLDAISNKEGEARALLGKGWCLWELARYAEAAKTFEKAYLAQADVASREVALTKQADASFANAQYAIAEDLYSRIRTEFPASPQLAEVAYQQGECLSRLGSNEKAEAVFRELAERHAGTEVADRAMMRIASLYQDRGDWERAARVNEEFMEARPKSDLYPAAWLGRATARYRLGQFNEAADDCDGILARYAGTETAEQAAFLRASCMYLLGDVREAVAAATEFLEEHPTAGIAPDVMFWLGEYEYNGGIYEAAERWFMQVIERHPQVAVADDALYWAGRAAAEQHEYRIANAHFSELCKVYTNSDRVAEARFGQGDALTELGEFAGAILAFDEVIRNYPKSEIAARALGRRGDCQFTLGSSKPDRYPEALNSYRLAYESPDATPDLKLQAEYKIGRCFEKMGRLDDAFEHYMNVVYAWLAERDQGRTPEDVWFTRAAFGAAAIKEAEGAWEQAISIYERVVGAGIPAGRDAEKRIEKIRSERRTTP